MLTLPLSAVLSGTSVLRARDPLSSRPGASPPPRGVLNRWASVVLREASRPTTCLGRVRWRPAHRRAGPRRSVPLRGRYRGVEVPLLGSPDQGRGAARALDGVLVGQKTHVGAATLARLDSPAEPPSPHPLPWRCQAARLGEQPQRDSHGPVDPPTSLLSFSGRRSVQAGDLATCRVRS